MKPVQLHVFDVHLLHLHSIIADTVAESLTLQYWPTVSDISGHIARSIVRSLKCDDCKEALVDPDHLLHLLELLQLEGKPGHFMSKLFVDSINRGGLSRPTEYCYTATLNCWRMYKDMKSSSALKDKLLGAESQRSFCQGCRTVENSHWLLKTITVLRDIT